MINDRNLGRLMLGFINGMLTGDRSIIKVRDTTHPAPEEDFFILTTDSGLRYRISVEQIESAVPPGEGEAVSEYAKKVEEELDEADKADKDKFITNVVYGDGITLDTTGNTYTISVDQLNKMKAMYVKELERREREKRMGGQRYA